MSEQNEGRLAPKKPGMSARKVRESAPKGATVEVAYTTINPPNGRGSLIGRSRGLLKKDAALGLDVDWKATDADNTVTGSGVVSSEIQRSAILSVKRIFSTGS